jgi:hypothetical protein
MLGLSPVPAENIWLDRLARVYLVARAYLTSFEAVRGRVFARPGFPGTARRSPSSAIATF